MDASTPYVEPELPPELVTELLQIIAQRRPAEAMRRMERVTRIPSHHSRTGA